MEYLQLLHHLRENKYHYQSYGNLDLNPDLIYARILTDRTLPYTTSTLYIAPADLLLNPIWAVLPLFFILAGL